MGKGWFNTVYPRPLFRELNRPSNVSRVPISLCVWLGTLRFGLINLRPINILQDPQTLPDEIDTRALYNDLRRHAELLLDDILHRPWLGVLKSRATAVPQKKAMGT